MHLKQMEAVEVELSDADEQKELEDHAQLAVATTDAAAATASGN